MIERIPRLSIGMPVYNGERYLRQAVDALLRQTYQDFELIVSDNGSTDRTAEICQAYAATDSRVRYYREAENRGACWNFNRVVELARGEYFKWAACDDICAPTFLARCVEVLDRDPGVICCHTRTGKIDQDGRPLSHLPDPTDGGIRRARLASGHRRLDASSPRAHRRFHDVLLTIGWSARSYAVVRTAALRRTSLIQPYYGYEKIVMAELSLQGRFHDVPEQLFLQREHAAASSSLDTVEGQQEFFDPLRAGGTVSPRLHLLRGYMQAATRAPIHPLERALCYVWIVRYLFQVGKWRSVWSSFVRRTGVRRG
jgi:glycosyltransferase involved in cell wall biosynthesis